jgi:cold shock CspA family protein
MQVPLQITYVHMQASKALDDRIREYVDQLDHRYGRVTSCRVVVEAPTKRSRKGMHYHASVDLSVPGGRIVVNRDPSLNKTHEHVYVAVHDAFSAARRKLEDHARRRRHKVKAHKVRPHGRVDEMFPERDFGLIETADGHEVYFHRNSIFKGNFDHLKIGDELRFCVEDGDAGPQASTVHVIGKHHIAAR